MNNNPVVYLQEELENLPSSFYLHAEAIFHLSEAQIDVKQARVSEWLGVSRANVSQVVSRMQNSGLIDFGDELKLSKKGNHIAKIIIRRHRITERFLSEILKLPWEKVYEESKKWEHALSPTTEEAMLKVLGDPKTGLFGNPIPYSNYFEGPMKKLLQVETKKEYSIVKISEELKKDSSIISFLQKNKLLPGNTVTIEENNDYSITVNINKNDNIGLNKFIADKVFVH